MQYLPSTQFLKNRQPEQRGTFGVDLVPDLGGPTLFPGLSDYEWKENFRLNKATFKFMTDKLRVKLQKTDTTFRKALPIDLKSIICSSGLLAPKIQVENFGKNAFSTLPSTFPLHVS